MSEPAAKQSEDRQALLEQQVTELYDRMQIEQLVTRYAYAVREQNVELVLSLFVDEQAAVDFDRSAIRDGGLRMGAAELRAVYARGFEELQPWPQLFNHLIEFQDATHATGIVSLELRTGTRGYQVAWIGTYRDVYEKAGSAWKFKSRAATVQHTPMLEEKVVRR